MIIVMCITLKGDLKQATFKIHFYARIYSLNYASNVSISEQMAYVDMGAFHSIMSPFFNFMLCAVNWIPKILIFQKGNKCGVFVSSGAVTALYHIN